MEETTQSSGMLSDAEKIRKYQDDSIIGIAEELELEITRQMNQRLHLSATKLLSASDIQDKIYEKSTRMDHLSQPKSQRGLSNINDSSNFQIESLNDVHINLIGPSNQSTLFSQTPTAQFESVMQRQSENTIDNFDYGFDSLLNMNTNMGSITDTMYLSNLEQQFNEPLNCQNIKNGTEAQSNFLQPFENMVDQFFEDSYRSQNTYIPPDPQIPSCLDLFNRDQNFVPVITHLIESNHNLPFISSPAHNFYDSPQFKSHRIDLQNSPNWHGNRDGGIKKQYRCTGYANCNKSYKNSNGLKYHLIHIHGKMPKIPICSDLSTLQGTIPTNFTHPQNRRYYCPYSLCDKVYRNISGLRYHFSNTHIELSLPDLQNLLKVAKEQGDQGIGAVYFDQ